MENALADRRERKYPQMLLEIHRLTVQTLEHRLLGRPMQKETPCVIPFERRRRLVGTHEAGSHLMHTRAVLLNVYAHRLPSQDDCHITPRMRDADERGGIGQIRLPRRLIEDFAIAACQFAQQSPHRQPLPPAVRSQETAFGLGHHNRRQEGTQLLMALAHLPDAPQAVNIIMLQQQRHDSLRQGD